MSVVAVSAKLKAIHVNYIGHRSMQEIFSQRASVDAIINY